MKNILLFKTYKISLVFLLLLSHGASVSCMQSMSEQGIDSIEVNLITTNEQMNFLPCKGVILPQQYSKIWTSKKKSDCYDAPDYEVLSSFQSSLLNKTPLVMKNADVIHKIKWLAFLKEIENYANLAFVWNAASTHVMPPCTINEVKVPSNSPEFSISRELRRCFNSHGFSYDLVDVLLETSSCFIDETEAPLIFSIIERFANILNIEKNNVIVTLHSGMNCSSTKFGNMLHIVLGLEYLRNLTNDETEFVLAHEMSHIALDHKDKIEYLDDLECGYCTELFSRSQEREADENALAITQKPKALISSLIKLQALANQVKADAQGLCKNYSADDLVNYVEGKYAHYPSVIICRLSQKILGMYNCFSKKRSAHQHCSTHPRDYERISFALQALVDSSASYKHF